MRMDINCVRDILLCIERDIIFEYKPGNSTMNELFPEQIAKDPIIAQNYLIDDVIYTIYKLAESDIIKIRRLSDIKPIPIFAILDLTPKGHEFLNSIRSDKVWDQVKDAIKKNPVTAISAVWQLASTIGSKILSEYA